MNNVAQIFVELSDLNGFWFYRILELETNRLSPVLRKSEQVKAVKKHKTRFFDCAASRGQECDLNF